MKTTRILLVLWSVAEGFLAGSLSGQEPIAGPIHQTLLPASRLVDRCDICGRPEIPLPLRGRFRVRFVEANPIQVVYAWEAIDWTAGGVGLPLYRVRGQGVQRWFGELAVFQEVVLGLTIETAQGVREAWFTNLSPVVERRWPVLRVPLLQTNGTFIQTFELLVEAAPVRDLWFSTVHGFTPGSGTGTAEPRREGDLVSWEGRVVRSQWELLGRLGMMPPPPELGLDAVDVLPGGEVVFSVRARAWSESLGQWLREGDLLSERGRVVQAVERLLAAFEPEGSVEEVNVDALVVRPDGELWFSIDREVTSARLRRILRRGDLLSSAGRVVHSFPELLSPFEPADPAQDPGLDALYVWPHGEIWFSVEDFFQDKQGNRYGAGDLLSDQGWVVAHNRDLLAAFQPLEDLADFGLDALQIVSDTDPVWSAVTMEPRLQLWRPPGTSHLQFDWTGNGRFYQLERALTLEGPWQPWGPVYLEPPAVDTNAVQRDPGAFYRLRQW
ncbi:MAG: hypothetical protein N2438_03110 [Limisphaera sp.]|nr:hypothetical protein [Limisphaera sp.]